MVVAAVFLNQWIVPGSRCGHAKQAGRTGRRGPTDLSRMCAGTARQVAPEFRISRSRNTFATPACPTRRFRIFWYAAVPRMIERRYFAVATFRVVVLAATFAIFFAAGVLAGFFAAALAVGFAAGLRVVFVAATVAITIGGGGGLETCFTARFATRFSAATAPRTELLTDLTAFFAAFLTCFSMGLRAASFSASDVWRMSAV